jgi:general secretion pathway protein H
MTVSSRSRSAGFTLIEILVVLVVVSMLVALATFTLGGNSQRRDLDNEAEQLFLLMQTVSEQAVLNNTEFGLVMEEDQYQFLAYDQQTGTWKPSQERIFRQRALPEWLVVTEYIENDAPRLERDNDDDQLVPDVVLFSSGETTPFELELTLGTEGLSQDNYVHSISSDGVSPVQWNHPGKSGAEGE